MRSKRVMKIFFIIMNINNCLYSKISDFMVINIKRLVLLPLSENFKATSGLKKN
jgi:hypothetical protein